MADSPEEAAELAALEEYLERLQAGGSPQREQILSAHPGLRSALRCLEVLEGIAPGGFGEPLDGEGCGSTVLGLPRDFGNYELIEELGRGGMGVVYKARQKDLDRIVAVKMILDSNLASEEHVRRFHEEARAAARVEHPGVIRIHEVGQFHEQHYFAMEYIEGASLSVHAAEVEISFAEAARLVQRVARAVDHLHRQGIVHRDLKPSNILIDQDREPHVTDFGLAKVFRAGCQSTATGVIVGTPSYMAPEQACGDSGLVGPASDVYSLGAILYELLTGRPPFREETPLDTVMKVLSAEPPLPRALNRKVPRDLELVCLKCLARDPGDRYPSAAALAEELGRFLKGDPIQVRPPSVFDRLKRWGRREPALAARLGVLGVFFCVEWGNYFGAAGDPRFVAFHWKIMALMGVWTLTAVVFQQWIKRKSGRWSIPARFLWGSLDSVLLFALLLIADGVASPLVVCYPLLIVASGLWMRVRFVWFIALVSLASYGIHVAHFYIGRKEQLPQFDTAFDRHVIFAVMLLGVAWGVGHLVRRIRVMSSYYDRNQSA